MKAETPVLFYHYHSFVFIGIVKGNAVPPVLRHFYARQSLWDDEILVSRRRDACMARFAASADVAAESEKVGWQCFLGKHQRISEIRVANNGR